MLYFGINAVNVLMSSLDPIYMTVAGKFSGVYLTYCTCDSIISKMQDNTMHNQGWSQCMRRARGVYRVYYISTIHTVVILLHFTYTHFDCIYHPII